MNIKLSRRFILIFIITLLLLATSVYGQSQVDPDYEPLTCETNNDCPSRLEYVCVSGLCQYRCSLDNRFVYQNSECTSVPTSFCGDDEVFSQTGGCQVNPCFNDNNCPRDITVGGASGSQDFYQNVKCAKLPQYDPSENLDVIDPGVQGVCYRLNFPCSSDEECDGGSCFLGACQPRCYTDNNCDGAEICSDGACIPPDCTSSSDCSGDANCVNGRCVTGITGNCPSRRCGCYDESSCKGTFFGICQSGASRARACGEGHYCSEDSRGDSSCDPEKVDGEACDETYECQSGICGGSPKTCGGSTPPIIPTGGTIGGVAGTVGAGGQQPITIQQLGGGGVAQFNFDCANADSTVLKLASLFGGGHGELYSDTNYNIGICFNWQGSGNPHTCTGDNLVVKLSSSTNAHAAGPDKTSTYSTDVCYSGYENCETVSGNSCGGGKTAVVKLSGDTNAHIASGGSTSPFGSATNTVCCDIVAEMGIPTPGPGESCTPGEQCITGTCPASGVCPVGVQPGQPGDSCSSSAECGTGIVCSNGVCGGDGATCSNNNQCASGDCDEDTNTCVDGDVRNNPCDDDSECLADDQFCNKNLDPGTGQEGTCDDKDLYDGPCDRDAQCVSGECNLDVNRCKPAAPCPAALKDENDDDQDGYLCDFCPDTAGDEAVDTRGCAVGQTPKDGNGGFSTDTCRGVGGITCSGAGQCTTGVLAPGTVELYCCLDGYLADGVTDNPAACIESVFNPTLQSSISITRGRCIDPDGDGQGTKLISVGPVDPGIVPGQLDIDQVVPECSGPGDYDVDSRLASCNAACTTLPAGGGRQIVPFFTLTGVLLSLILITGFYFWRRKQNY